MSKKVFSTVIQFFPERIDIKNFQQGKAYTEPVTIFNCVDVPIALKIKSSDSNKIHLSDTSIKINSKQSKEILLTIKEDKGIKIINERKRLFIWVKGDLVEEKFIIEFQYNNANEHKKATSYHSITFDREHKSFGFIELSRIESFNYFQSNAKEPKAWQSNIISHWFNNLSINNQEAFELRRCMDYGLIDRLNKENEQLRGTLNRIVKQYNEIQLLLESWSQKAQEIAIRKYCDLSIQFNETMYLNGYVDNSHQYAIDNLIVKIKEIEIENKVLTLENNTLKLRMKVIGTKTNNKESNNEHEKENKFKIEPMQSEQEKVKAQMEYDNKYWNREKNNGSLSLKERSIKHNPADYLCDLEIDYSKNKTLEEYELLLIK